MGSLVDGFLRPSSYCTTRSGVAPRCLEPDTVARVWLRLRLFQARVLRRRRTDPRFGEPPLVTEPMLILGAAQCISVNRGRCCQKAPCYKALAGTTPSKKK